MKILALAALAAAASFAVPASAREAAPQPKRLCAVQPNHIPAGKIILPPVVRCSNDATPKPPVSVAKVKPILPHPSRMMVVAGMD